jgi:hypothetical protein
VDQSTRQNLTTAFNSVLRTSTLVGKIDQQRTSLAFAALLHNLPDGTTVVPLGPLYDFLLGQKAPETDVRETLVFFQSREARFGVKLDLPPQLKSLSEAERGRIILAVTARGQTTNTHPGPVAKPAPDRTEPPPADVGFVPEKKKKDKGPAVPRRLVFGFAFSLLGLAASVGFDAATRLPEPRAVALNDPNGLPCEKLFETDFSYVCSVKDAFVKATPMPALKARAEMLRNAAVARGMKKRPVHVLSLERGDLLHVF